MPAEDVERLLQSIDQDRPQGRRDYAIVLLLARLGLRAREVAALRLEDVDWDAGELVIRGKGGGVERLPLPWEVGEALSRYLRDARPPCSIRQVFVCLRAPRRGFHNGSAVGTIVRRALARADLHPPHRGAHLLRHSLATRLLRNGASLVEIGSCYAIATSTPPGSTPRSMSAPWAGWHRRGREVRDEHPCLRPSRITWPCAKRWGFRCATRATCCGDSWRSSNSKGHVHHPELAVHWAYRAPRGPARGVVPALKSRPWLSPVIAVRSDPRTQIPARGCCPTERSGPRRIFTATRRSVSCCRPPTQLPSPTGLRAQTYVTAFGLLAVTGMRVGELVGLDDQDVDLPWAN